MKNTRLILAILILAIGIGFVYFINTHHHVFYSSICGSGLNGIKLFIIEYASLILIVLAVMIIAHHKRKKDICKICGRKHTNNFDICPYCGSSTREGENVV